jgi:hypothetical protein
MGLFNKTELEDDFMEDAQAGGKAKRKKKRGLKGQGFERRTAKRMTGESQEPDVIQYGKGGKTSAKKTKHRGKTSYGRHQGY